MRWHCARSVYVWVCWQQALPSGWALLTKVLKEMRCLLVDCLTRATLSGARVALAHPRGRTPGSRWVEVRVRLPAWHLRLTACRRAIRRAPPEVRCNCGPET